MKDSIFCSIITIGDELLIGQIMDTNSAWIAQQLNPLGIQVRKRIAVGDVKEEVLLALNEERKKSQIIMITGGLGPTSDDITKPLLCEYFQTKLIENKEVLAHITEIFKKRNRPMIESNIQQAYVPENCQVLFNKAGTAPGMLFQEDDVVFISMPGVPYEMEYIINHHVISYLKEKFITQNFIHKTVITFGLGESFLAERLIPFETQLPKKIKLAYLPKFNIVKLRLTASDIAEHEFNEYVELLKSYITDIYVADEDIELEQALAKVLAQHNRTISTAESCTGGEIASRITSIKGASTYFQGSIVSYSIKSKINLLGVDNDVIEKYGVVSKETVEEMAKKCREKFQTDYALSISGYLEKGDFNNEVWIGVATKNNFYSLKMNTFYDRKKNTELASNTALYFFRKCILKDYQSEVFVDKSK